MTNKKKQFMQDINHQTKMINKNDKNNKNNNKKRHCGDEKNNRNNVTGAKPLEC
jgi:hypothetical protein